MFPLKTNPREKLSSVKFMLAPAAATAGDPDGSSAVKNFCRVIYGCGGGLHVASILSSTYGSPIILVFPVINIFAKFQRSHRLRSVEYGRDI